MITPFDIEKKEFSKGVRGYNIEEVDEFLDQIIVDLEKLMKKAEPTEKEKEMLERMKNGDREARAMLIEHNLRLVAHIVKKYSAQCDSDDLVSIGTIGLIKAIDSFDLSKAARLSSYASRCIENEILMYFRSLRKHALDVSLDETIDTDKDGNSLTLIDIIADETDIAAQTAVKLSSERMLRCLERLPRREKEIIVMRYGIDGEDPLTQRQIAAKLGISRSYVSRIEKRAAQMLEDIFDSGEI